MRPDRNLTTKDTKRTKAIVARYSLRALRDLRGCPVSLAAGGATRV